MTNQISSRTLGLLVIISLALERILSSGGHLSYGPYITIHYRIVIIQSFFLFRVANTELQIGK